MISFVPPRVPLVDTRTGLITREWYLLFQSLFTTGGMDDGSLPLIAPAAVTLDAVLAAVGIVRDEFASAPPAPAVAVAADDLAPPPAPLFVAIDDVLPVINGLRDEIAMLRAMVDDMKQGGITL